MGTIKKIMVAVDFSPHTEPAVQYGLSLARDLKAELLFVNVVDRRDLMPFERYMIIQDPALCQKCMDDLYASRNMEIQKCLEKAADHGVAAHGLVKTGVPYQELLSVIEAESPSLLIMGTKGRSNLTDTIIGSCAQKLYRRCPIPLLTLRPPKQ